jgi:hypothetical protein
MFKDPLTSKDAAEKMIEMKTKETVYKLLETQQTDQEFVNNLMDLCLLNKMANSYNN